MEIKRRRDCGTRASLPGQLDDLVKRLKVLTRCRGLGGLSGPIQVRVADALLPLSVLFGLPAVIGLTLGVLVGNLFASPFGAIDVVGGTIANFVATLLALLIGERKFRGAWVAATSVEILVITFIVGTYLAFLTETPLLFSLLYVMVGEVLSVGVGGYLLLNAVNRALRRSSL